MSTTNPSTGSTDSNGAGSNTPGQADNRNQGDRGRYPNRNRRYNRSNNSHNNNFKGATSELEDCTFGLHEGYAGAKRYTDNIKKLKIYAYKNCNSDQGALFGTSPSLPTLDKPTIDDATDLELLEIFKLELREYMDEKRKMAKDTKKLYAIILGQCTEALLSKIKANEDFEEKNDDAEEGQRERVRP